MTTTVTCRHAAHHAVVELHGPITWTGAMELVATVDALVERYAYRHVVLVVTSPGGLIAALEHLLRALARWRTRGVAVDTRVVAEAASAAAVLVALGDRRTAEPGATLLFHLSRVLGAPEVTADLSSRLHGELSRVDRALVARLVDRALRTAGAPAHAADPCDRPVLEHLASAVPLTRRTRPSPRSVRGLARAVGRAVDAACEHRDERALARIYRALAHTEHAVSAPLARTLRLVDHVGEREAPVAGARAGPPGLTVPEWAALYPPDGTVPRALLTRHALAIGETGSGKTASAVLPLVAAMARAPRERLAAALIIDPKREIAPILERIAPQRLEHLDAGTLRLDLMAGPRWSLDADLAAERWLTAARKVLLRVASLVPASPLRALAGQMPAEVRDPFFDRQGSQLALDVVAFVLMLTGSGAPDPDAWLADPDTEVRDWVAALLARARGTGAGRGPNLVALTAWALDGPLVATLSESSGHTYDGATAPERWLWSRIAARAFAAFAQAPGEARDLLRRIAGYWAPLAAIEKQHAGVLATASTACADFAAPAVATTLYFGCEPGAGDSLDLARRVSPAGADGRLLVFQPARDALDRLVAVSLKALLFEAVLADPDRARGDPGVPLVGYVADEFHQFVTADPVHGEQSFLDTCRSFGAFCLLATQSVASIEHALSAGGANRASNEAAVAVMLNNTATKLVFRTTDAATADRVADLCPTHPGWAAPTRVRPLSTLAPGECVAVLADGRVHREQLRPLEPVAGTGARKAAVHIRPHRPARDGAVRNTATNLDPRR